VERGEWDAKGVFVYFACFAVYSRRRVLFMTLQWPGFSQMLSVGEEYWGFFLIIA